MKQRSCEPKVRYGHRPTALRAVDAMFAKDGKTGARLEAYRCQYCDGWHIGHSNKVMVRVMRREG